MKQNNKNGKNTPKKRNAKIIMPAVEEAKVISAPKFELLPDDSDKTPTLIDPENYGSTIRVEDGHVYTLRLGVHAYCADLAPFREDCAAACYIPTTPGREQRIIGLFFVPKIYPVKFMDVINLQATRPFTLRYLWGSAALENNNNASILLLDGDSVITERDAVIILENNLRNRIHSAHCFHFDVLRVQVEVKFTK